MRRFVPHVDGLEGRVSASQVPVITPHPGAPPVPVTVGPPMPLPVIYPPGDYDRPPDPGLT